MRNNYKQTFQDLKVVGWYFCSVFEEEENEKDEEEKKTLLPFESARTNRRVRERRDRLSDGFVDRKCESSSARRRT